MPAAGPAPRGHRLTAGARDTTFHPDHGRTAGTTTRTQDRRIMSELTKPVSDDSFKTDVLQATGPVLVDFWAEWCGPCRMVAPILDEIAKDYEGQLTIAKVNIDENPVTPNDYAVRGIPTMILFKDGKPVETKVGALPKSQLKDWIASALAK
jgi:thioredoxin 1